ncbi:MAG TPA: tetratricopeptide repeat protein [Stellaceae bacterium]|nr:tetratricopeptide repeat protein [Stellaceae bacterium]
MMRELPASWSDMDVDPTLRLLAERAARIAGIPVSAWLEHAIRRACPEYFVPAAPVATPAPTFVEPPRPMAPPHPTLPPPLMPQIPSASAPSGAGAALAELMARARQPRPEAPQTMPAPTQFVPPAPPPMPSPAAPPAADFAAPQPSSLERARDSKRRAAAFATEVADWRTHEEQPARTGAPWPAFNENLESEPYVPLDTDTDAEFDTREPLELRNPIRARRSRRPLLIAVGLALAVAFGAIGAQRFISGRLGHFEPVESAALSTPTNTPTTMSRQAALPPLTPQAVTPAPAPAPSIAMVPSSPNTMPLAPANDTGALLPPSLVSPENSPSPPPSVTASTPAPNAVPPSTAPVAMQPPAAAVPEPEQPAATVAATPALPPPLPPRKIVVAKPAPEKAPQQAEVAANIAARQAADAAAPKDPAKLASWLEQRAKTGDAVAEYRLGVLYALGQGVKQDYAHAAQLFKSAANGGVAEAQYNVAVMYSEGMGVQRDPAQAVTWYEKAAEQGNANAAFNLGVAYSNGAGVQQNIQEAARWFRRAASAGVINAQFNLGLLYERGEGVPQSLVEAYAWYAAAAVRGDQGAAQRRDHIASALSPGDLKKAQARATQLQQTIQTSTGPTTSQKANAATP